RHRDHDRHRHLLERADDGVRGAALGAGIERADEFQRFGEERDTEQLDALGEDVGDDQQQRDEERERSRRDDDRHETIEGDDPSVHLAHDGVIRRDEHQVRQQHVADGPDERQHPVVRHPHQRQRRQCRAEQDPVIGSVERARADALRFGLQRASRGSRRRGRTGRRRRLEDARQTSTPLPDRERLTMIDASMFTMSVTAKSVSPAAINALNPNSLASPKRSAMRLATEFPPEESTSLVISNFGEMMSATAIVSPSARPSPSIEPPMIPPRPKGSTTERIMPHRAAPSASAPSYSPGGVWENTSRITDVAMGSTISDTTTPAMKFDES